MTLLAVGGQDTSFTIVDGGVSSGGGAGGAYRTNFSNCVITVNVGQTAADPPTSYISLPPFTPNSTLWVHGQFGTNTSGNSNALNVHAMRVLDGSGVPRIVIRGTGTAGQMKISTRNAGGSFVDLTLTTSKLIPSVLNGPVAFDLYINYSILGQVTLYANGAIVLDTGSNVNVTTDGATSLAQCQFGTFTNQSGATAGWSEIITQTTVTLGMALWTLPPTGAGNTQAWTPNTLANVNKLTIDDTTSVATASVDELSEWTVSAGTLPTGVWNIIAVVQEARVECGTTGPQSFGWIVRTEDGTDHLSGDVPLITTFQNYSNIWLTNPFTGGNWAAGDLVNIGIESLT